MLRVQRTHGLLQEKTERFPCLAYLIRLAEIRHRPHAVILQPLLPSLLDVEPS